MIDRIKENQVIVCIIGLGYIGMPLAEAFSKDLKVIGYDTDSKKITELKQNLKNNNLSFTDRDGDISAADFFIICVPTPVSRSREPDLSYIKAAANVVSQNMKRNSTIKILHRSLKVV